MRHWCVRCLTRVRPDESQWASMRSNESSSELMESYESYESEDNNIFDTLCVVCSALRWVPPNALYRHLLLKVWSERPFSPFSVGTSVQYIERHSFPSNSKFSNRFSYRKTALFCFAQHCTALTALDWTTLNFSEQLCKAFASLSLSCIRFTAQPLGAFRHWLRH